MPIKIRIGDIIEIPTSRGIAYAQYTHEHERYGALIRVLDGLFESRPKDFSELVNKKHRFVTFFPLRVAVNRKIFKIVGHAEVPEEAKAFPLFRAEGWIDKSGKVLDWWLWDGKKEWQIGQLTPEQRKLPIDGIVNLKALIYMIESGWTPENDLR